MRRKVFPRDAIEASAARVAYGLDGATYAKLVSRLPAWRLGSATFHSDSDLRRLIRENARFEPSSHSADRKQRLTA